MNTKQIKYVLVLAREGSFSQAAECLNISQPSLSQYIKKIEKETETTLFDRSGSTVVLTEAGKVYVETGQKILEMEHRMEQQFSDLAAHKTGHIVVGISPYRSICYMPQVARKFHEQYPGMHLVVEERVGRDLIAGAENGEFDLCITTLPIDEKQFSYECIMREQFVLAVSQEYAFYEKIASGARVVANETYPEIDMQLCASMDFVMLGETQVMQHVLENLCEEEHISIQKAVECRSIETQLSMVKAGMGMALVPSTIARFSKDKDIRFYSLKQHIPHRDVVVMYRKGQKLSQAMKDLKDIFLQAL